MDKEGSPNVVNPRNKSSLFLKARTVPKVELLIFSQLGILSCILFSQLGILSCMS